MVNQTEEITKNPSIEDAFNKFKLHMKRSYYLHDQNVFEIVENGIKSFDSWLNDSILFLMKLIGNNSCLKCNVQATMLRYGAPILSVNGD